MNALRQATRTTAKWLALAGWIVLSNAAGLIGSLFTRPQVDNWYAELSRPELAPPNWVFGPVWTALYILMGCAAWLVWLRRLQPGAGAALILFCIQLALNLLWSIIFFGYRQIGVALAEILLLWLAILLTIIAFFRVRPLAAWLLTPYLAWVTFAAYLNFMYWQLNR